MATLSFFITDNSYADGPRQIPYCNPQKNDYCAKGVSSKNKLTGEHSYQNVMLESGAGNGNLDITGSNTKITAAKGVAIDSERGDGGDNTFSAINITDGATLKIESGGIVLEGMQEAYPSDKSKNTYGNGQARLNIGSEESPSTKKSKVEIDGLEQEIWIGPSNPSQAPQPKNSTDILNIYKDGELVIDGSTSVHGIGTINLDGGTVLLDGKDSSFSFNNAKVLLENATFSDGKDSLTTSGGNQWASFTNTGSELAAADLSTSGDVTTEGNVSLSGKIPYDPKKPEVKPASTSSLNSSNLLVDLGSVFTLTRTVNSDTSTGIEHGTVKGVLNLNGVNGDQHQGNYIKASNLDIVSGGILQVTGDNTLKNTGTIDNPNIIVEQGGKIDLVSSAGQETRLDSPEVGLIYNKDAVLKFNGGEVTMPGFSDSKITPSAFALTGTITGTLKNDNLTCELGTTCIANTGDHISIYGSRVDGSLTVETGKLFMSFTSELNGVNKDNTAGVGSTLDVQKGAYLQLQSRPNESIYPHPRISNSSRLIGEGRIDLEDSGTLNITGDHFVASNINPTKNPSHFSGEITGDVHDGTPNTTVNFGGDIEIDSHLTQDIFGDCAGGSCPNIGSLTNLNFARTATLGNAILDQVNHTQFFGNTSFNNSKATAMGTIILGNDNASLKSIGGTGNTAGIVSLEEPASHKFDASNSSIDAQYLTISQFTPPNTLEASGEADSKLSETANLSESTKVIVHKELDIGDKASNEGILNLKDSSLVEAYTKALIGADGGDGTVDITNSSDFKIIQGFMNVGGKTGSGAITAEKKASLSLDTATLNIKNTGAVYISDGGILNAKSSSISLGNVPPAIQSFDDNKTSDTPPKFDDGLVRGDININHGTLNVTGNAGAAKFSGMHTGNLELHNGSTLNVGTAEAAGSLNVDGNMIIADDTISHFYEGDAKPCPTGDSNYSCSHGPSKEGNPSDDSVIRVSGDLHLGGTLNVSGTGEQSNQFDEGLYTIYTYGGHLSGRISDLNIEDGDYKATIYKKHNGEVDVLIWNKDDAPPVVVDGGKTTWDNINKNGDTSKSVIIDGQDSNGNPADTDITIKDGQTASTPNIIIHSGGTTIQGGSISGKPTTPSDGDSPIHINVNGDDNASGKISSNITDPTKQGTDGNTVPDGHTSIKKDGGGDLVIDGGKKDYTGSTDVAGGTLDIGNKDADPTNPKDTADITNSSGTTVDNGGTVNVNTGSKAGGITVNGGGTANVSGQTSHIDNKGGTTNINGDDSQNTKPKPTPNDPDSKNTISNTDGGTVNVNDGGIAGKIDSKDSNINVNKGGEAGDISSDGGAVNIGDGGASGSITVDGGGTANIDGQTGKIAPDGKPGNGDVTAHDGSSISGSGTIHGNTSVDDGGTIHAGSTINPDKKDGDLNIDGDLNMGGNSTIDGSSGATINVHGKTNIDQGVHVHINGNGGCTEAGEGKCDSKVIVHTDGGITGGDNLSPDDVNSGPLVKRKVVIGGDGKDIDVISSIPTYVVPGANSSTGHGLDDLSHNNSDAAHSILDPLGRIESVDGLKKAYKSLSGEINADARTAMFNSSYMLQEATIGRLDCLNDDLRKKAFGNKMVMNNYCGINPKHPITVWGRMYGTRGDSFGSHGSNLATMHQSTTGWIVGADAQIAGTWRVGGLISYGHDWFSAREGLRSYGNSNDVSLGMYAGNSWQMNNSAFDAALTLKMGAIYTWNIMHTRRSVDFPGYSGTLSSNTLGGTFQGFTELGYKMMFNKDKKIPIEVEPFTRMSFVNFGEGRFAEHGATAALLVQGEDTTVGYIDMGFKVASSIPVGKEGSFSPHMALSYRRAFGNTNTHIHEAFAAANSGNYDMSVSGVPISVDTADVNIGFTAHISENVEFDLDYIGQYGNHVTSSGGMGTIRVRF